MIRFILKTILVFSILYCIICVLLYFYQEKLIFFPQKLNSEHQFRFDQPFEELTIVAEDKTPLHGLLFKTDHTKGLIFYLHGNAGSLESWGHAAQTYTDLNYDVFMLDYRGYGKSQSSITREDQFFADIQQAYNELKKRYAENKIIVTGYSIGTGAAAKIASTNNPKLLILQAPYYSLTDLMQHTYRIIPTFILKYKFDTSKYLKQCAMPVVIFHGDYDGLIYHGSSLKLQAEFKPTDTLITLHKQGHNGMNENPEYRAELEKILGFLAP